METAELAEAGNELLDNIYAPATKAKYDAYWNEFLEFVLDLDLEFSEQAVCEYIQFLYETKYAYSSIAGRLSAISVGLQARKEVDSTKAFLPKLLLKGVKRQNKTSDHRKPFTEKMVHELIMALPEVLEDPYMIVMFAALFSWAYYGGLRCSEYTMPVVADHNLHINDICRLEKGDRSAYRLRFRSYKHSPDYIPDFIMTQAKNQLFCPVFLMDQYLNVRKDVSEDLFVDHVGPVTRLELDNLLTDCLNHLGWDVNSYESHSFRIGRATDWMSQGYSPAQIMQMGRWRSEAYKVYLRPAVITLS